MRSKHCDLVVDNSQERTHGEGLSKIAMELSTEELQDEVERLLRRCSFDHLREVGNLLGLVEDDFGGDKLSVRRAINDVFDAVDTADEKISLFSSIKSALLSHFNLNFRQFSIQSLRMLLKWRERS